MSDYLNLILTWPSIIFITSITIYIYSRRNHNYWKSRGIGGPKPLPFIGTIYQIFRNPFCVQLLDNHKKFGRLHGIYEGNKPTLVVAEPVLIRDVFVKDFSSFVDRGIDSFGHPLFDRSLLLARGDQWKQTRVIVSPTFSSSKMRKMQFLIEGCVERLIQAMDKLVYTEIDVRKVMGNYTMDVIALCAFATILDTHKTDGELHPFVKNANIFFTPSPQAGIFFALNAICPYLVKKFNITFVPSYAYLYFEKMLKQIISERESTKSQRSLDFLQLLIDAKDKTDNKDIDEDIKREVQKINESMQSKKNFKLEEIDILATSLLFILAGSETTSSTLSYLFHELALHPEYQEILFNEIKYSGDILDYDTVSQMPYLDACIAETLRMYPPLVQHQRTATEDYELGGTGIKIPKLMSIMVPVYAMHHDPEFFPDPEQYKPDRFMPENKSQIIPYTYLPFGTGPRNCVGMRFALMNIKTAVVHILSKYRFIKTPNTVTNFVYKKFNVFTQPIDMGTILLEPRN